MPVKKYFTSEERKEGRRLSRIKYKVAHPDRVKAQAAKSQHKRLAQLRIWRRHDSLGLGAKFSTLKCRGRRKSLIVTLTFEQFQHLHSLPCDYCGEALPLVGTGVDRKDNAIGYTLENSVPCCTRCNTMKGAYLTYDEMKLIWENRKGALWEF